MKSKKLNSSIFDLILLIIYLFSALYFMAEIYLGELFSLRLSLMIGGLLAVVFFALFFSVVKNTKGKLLWRVLIIFFDVSLIVGAFYQLTLRDALHQINTAGQTIYHLSLYVDDPKIQNMEDFHQGVIGILDGQVSNNTYVQDELKKIKADVSYREYLDESTLADALMDGEVDGILISDFIYSKMMILYPELGAEMHPIRDFNRIDENAVEVTRKDLLSEPFTVFISGIDQNGNINLSAKSDANMLLLVDPIEHHVEIISLLRDTYVPNPAYDYYPDKLTHTSIDGVENTMTAIEEVFGFPIDYVLRVNFSSLVKVVDAMDGLKLEIPQAFCEQNSKNSFDPMICVEAGMQTLNGEQTLAYARHRSSYSDIERTQAHQQILTTMIIQLLRSNLNEITEVMKVATENTVTNLELDSIKAFVRNELDTPQQWSFTATSLTKGAFHSLPCISWDFDWPLNVYVLSKQDIAMVYEKYTAMFKKHDLSMFAFDLDEPLPEYLLPNEEVYVITTEDMETKLEEVFALLPADPLEVYEWQDEHKEEDAAKDDGLFDPLDEIRAPEVLAGEGENS